MAANDDGTLSVLRRNRARNPPVAHPAHDTAFTAVVSIMVVQLRPASAEIWTLVICSFGEMKTKTSRDISDFPLYEILDEVVQVLPLWVNLFLEAFES
jgi:hypothetical protein